MMSTTKNQNKIAAKIFRWGYPTAIQTIKLVHQQAIIDCFMPTFFYNLIYFAPYTSASIS